MAQQYDDTNKGILWRNHRKTGKQPDWRGKINIQGQEFELAAWDRKNAKDGSPMLSLSVSLPRDNEEKVPF